MVELRKKGIMEKWDISSKMDLAVGFWLLYILLSVLFFVPRTSLSIYAGLLPSFFAQSWKKDFIDQPIFLCNDTKAIL